jgi:GNAT superfamily N-acetyltransferase
VSSSEFHRLRGAERPERLRSFFGGKLAPGMLAYSGGEPVGWCAFGPRSEMARLQRSKTIQKLDDLPVVSIFCFVVRSDHRRRGLARTLLEGAVGYLERQGVEIAEAYPIENAGQKVSSAFAYVGTVALFESVGFERAAKTAAVSARKPRWIMRKQLQQS